MNGNMKKKIIIGVALMIYIVFIMTKRIQSESSEKQNDLASEQTTIVTSFYPMYMHTKALTEGVNVEVINMASPQVGCLHDYQLTVEDMRKIQDGQIFVMNGLGAETFQSKAYEQNPNLQIIDASSHWLETHGDHEEEEVLDAGHAHDHENEHLWVSIEGSMAQVQAISEGLQQYDPVHAADYAANEKKYMEQLGQLKAKMEEELVSLEGEQIITVHETFEYLAEELGVQVIGTIAAGEQTSLTSKQMEQLTKQLRVQKKIFTEPQYANFAVVATLARESGATIYELDSFVTEDTHLKGDLPEYIERMNKNIEVLKEAYGL